MRSSVVMYPLSLVFVNHSVGHAYRRPSRAGETMFKCDLPRVVF